MSDDFATALTEALLKRANDTDLPRMPRSTANQNHPFKPEARRAPRGDDPSKWSPPPYRDRDAERIAGRLSKKEKKR